MDLKENSFWAELLRQPGISHQNSQEELYRAACIGAVTLLYESGDAAALAESTRRAASPESRARALFALESLTKTTDPVRSRAIRELHRLAVLDGNRDAAAFLQKSGLQDSETGWNSARMLLFGQKHLLLKTDPGPRALSELFLHAEEPLCLRLLTLAEKILPNWTVLMQFLKDPADSEKREELLKSYRSFSPEERELICFAADTGDGASSVIPDILLRYEDETALKLCLEHDLHPSNPSQEALFCFLSRQWDRYYAADSSYRRIRIAYEQNDPSLQRRLIAISRESGNSSWLRYISGSIENLPNSGTLSDQHLLISTLAEQKQWKRLWEILPGVPLLCMPAVCRTLREADFKPDQPEEIIFLNELSDKIDACSGLSPVPIRQKLAENSGTAIGICGGGPFTAVLYSDRRILIWDKRQAGAEPFRISSNHLSFRKAVISRDGKYLTADCGKDGITVFSLPGGQAVKVIAGDGTSLIGLFLQTDGRRLITLAQNGHGTVFAFPGGTELFHFDIGLRNCSNAVWDPQSGHICGITSEGSCTVYDINAKRIITALEFNSEIAAASEEYSKGRVAFIERENTFSSVNLLSGKALHDHLSTGGDSPRRLSEYASGDLFLLGTLSGKIEIFDPTVRETAALLSFGTKSAVTGLWYDAEDSFLYGCTASGAVCQWDMKLFNHMIRILPLTELPGLNRIDDFCKKYPEPGVRAAASWLKTVILWRRRFDIEVEFGDE